MEKLNIKQSEKGNRVFGKICKQCELPKNNFRKGKCRSGYVYQFNYCADCQNENARKKYWDNPKKANEYNKKWREKNKDKKQAIYKKSRRKYYLKNKIKILAYSGKRQKKELKELPDYYIKARLKLPDAPSELIEAKKLQLKLKRIIRGRETNK